MAKLLIAISNNSTSLKRAFVLDIDHKSVTIFVGHFIMENKTVQDHLESKIWYRLIKVVYIVLLVLSFFIVVVIAYSYHPISSTYTDGTKTLIVCDNGKSVRNKYRYITNYNDISDKDDIELKSICKFGESDTTALEHQKKGELPMTKNYRMDFYQTTNNYGSWIEVLIILVMGIPIVYTIFEVIKRVFLYIAIGKNPLKIK